MITTTVTVYLIDVKMFYVFFIHDMFFTFLNFFYLYNIFILKTLENGIHVIIKQQIKMTFSFLMQ